MDTLRGKRNHAMLLLLIGCGLRRAELPGLTMNSIQLREEHWVIADLRPTYGLRHPAAGSNPSAWKTSRSCIALTFNEGFPTIPPHKRRSIYERKFHMAEFTAGSIGSARREALKLTPQNARAHRSKIRVARRTRSALSFVLHIYGYAVYQALRFLFIASNWEL